MKATAVWKTILALLIHLVPTSLVLLALAIAWRWEWIRGFAHGGRALSLVRLRGDSWPAVPRRAAVPVELAIQGGASIRLTNIRTGPIANADRSAEIRWAQKLSRPRKLGSHEFTAFQTHA